MKEKTSKIIVITSTAIIGLLILAVILLAVIPVNRGFVFNASNKATTIPEGYHVTNKLADSPDVIIIRRNDQNATTAKSGELVLYADKIKEQGNIYTEIMNKLKTAGEFKILDSMFGGYASKTSGTKQLSSSQTFSELYNEDGEYCVILRWYTPQSIQYVNTNNNTVDYLYDEAYIQLNAKSEVTAINAYLKQYNTTNSYSRVVYFGYLNTYDLYDYATTLTYDVR